MITERRYDIDWLRTIAIGLLLIYHIAIVFQPWAMFIGFIRSDEFMEDLWIPMSMLNVWRIPFLFFVSGMGVYFAIRKRNWKQFLFERCMRILVPFTFGLLAITPLHSYIFQHYYKLPLSYFSHPGHLWFLGNICIYVLLFVPLFFYLKKQKEESSFRRGLSRFMNNPLGPLSVVVFFVMEGLLVKPQVFAAYALTAHGFFLGMLAFLFGFLFVYSGKSFWQTLSKCWVLYLVLAAALYTLRLTAFQMQPPVYLLSIESHLWILTVLGLGYKYLNKPGAALRYLSRSAYPVYIIHMFALYLGAMIILPLTIPVILKFVLIVLFTFLICYLIYEFLIRRIGWLGILFGLKWKGQDKVMKRLQGEPVQLTSPEPGK